MSKIPGTPSVISEEDLQRALDDAAAGVLTSDLEISDDIQAVLDRVYAQRHVDLVDEEEALRLRQVMEDEENIAEADSSD